MNVEAELVIAERVVHICMSQIDDCRIRYNHAHVLNCDSSIDCRPVCDEAWRNVREAFAAFDDALTEVSRLERIIRQNKRQEIIEGQ